MTFNEKKIAIIARNCSFEAVHSMVSIVSASVSLGWDVHILFSCAALYKYVKSDLNDVDLQTRDCDVQAFFQKSRKRIPDLGELFKQALDTGRVKTYACVSSSAMVGLKPEEAKRFESILDHKSFLKIASDCKLVVL